MRLRFITHTPVILSTFGPEAVREAFYAAHVFYYLKKDKSVERAVRGYLRGQDVRLDNLVERMRALVDRTHPFRMNITLEKDDLEAKSTEVVPLSLDGFDDPFQSTVFVGEALLNVETDISLARMKALGLSYTESMLDAERRIFRELFYPELEELYVTLLGEIKTRWDIPMRMGMFNRNRLGGNLLFFWRIKEVREHIRRRLRFDIQPREILYLPEYRTIPGLVELRAEE